MLDDPYLYRVKTIVSAYDGDTCNVILHASRQTPRQEIDFGFGDVIVIEGQTITKDTFVEVRMYGFDTPELKDKRPDWKAAAYLARDKAVEWLESALNGPGLLMRTHRDRSGKYGRFLANFLRADDHNSTLKLYLMNNNLAVLYHGQSKDDIAAAHAANIAALKERGEI